MILKNGNMREYMKKIKIELLNNDETGGLELNNEPVIIYENIIKDFNIVYDYHFDDIFSYYRKYVNKIFNEFKYKKTKIIQDASDIFECDGETIDDNRDYILLFLYKLSNESIKEEIIKQEKTKSLLYLLKSKNSYMIILDIILNHICKNLNLYEL